MTIVRSVLIAIVAAAVVLLAVVIGWEPGSAPSEGPSTGLKVIVLGIDGADWYVLGKLVDEGRMKSLSALLKRSLTGRIAADTPAVPDVGWTVLGRGMKLTDEELEVVGVGDGQLTGLAPEVADIVALQSGTALSVGWPASWPAGGEGEEVVAAFTYPSPLHATGLPPTLYEDGVDQSQPVGLDVTIQKIVARNEEACEAEFRRTIFDGRAADDMWKEQLLAARWAFLSDMITLDTAASLIASEEPDVALVCLSGLDAVEHRFLGPALPQFFKELPPGSDKYADVLPNYYAFVDRAIERLRRLTDEQTVFIICSVYGIHPDVDTPGMFGSHANEPPGVLIVRGPGISPRPEAIDVATEDVAPTVLALLGLRIPTELQGRVVQEMLPGDLLKAHPPAYSGHVDIEPSEARSEDVAVMEGLAEIRLELVTDQMNRTVK
jgi:hypothetical protein